ncbi:CTP-dependent riboflavin kinase [Natronomonas marina]|jgi:riboflavin kinase|uniref:CTP-dependent riboflavin kinase n=1 Tax=Natronomonas marina TaxID=2961939 RepID=UPI0020C992AF|nr:CTP-dependent riboflavin kinase [Natronomonas marina]
MARTAERAGHDELATLKLVALDGALDGRTTVTCSSLADRLDASNQTASRRLQRLEDADYLEREMTGDGQLVAVTETGERALQREYADYRRLFEGDADVELSGVVTSGMGEGRHYISLPGYMRQFRERLGYEPFAGTLNVDLDDESVRDRARMDALDPIEIDGWEDDERTYGPAFCWPAAVERAAGSDEGAVDRYETAHVIAPERTHHGEDQLEVIAPDRLRDELKIEDGDRLTVHVLEQ